MELKNTDDLRLFIRNTIHEQYTNVTAVSRKAKVSQPSLNNFVSAKREKAISTYTMFPVLEALGKRLVVADSSPILEINLASLPSGRTVKEVLDEMQKQPMRFVPTPKVTKESLSAELRGKIEEYQSSPDPKPKFSVDLIVKFLEESYDKLATV